MPRLRLLFSAYALTLPEREVAQRVLRGLNNKTIARGLSVSPLPVRRHLKSVFNRVGVHRRGELVSRVLAEYQTPRGAG